MITCSCWTIGCVHNSRLIDFTVKVLLYKLHFTNLRAFLFSISIFLKFGMLKWIWIDHGTLQLMVDKAGQAVYILPLDTWLWCQCCNKLISLRHVKDLAGSWGKTSFVQRQLKAGKIYIKELVGQAWSIWQSILHFKERNSIMTYRTKLITLCSLDLCWLQIMTTCWFWEKIGFALNLCLKFQNYSKVLCKIPYLVNIHCENGKESVIFHNIWRFFVLNLLLLLNGHVLLCKWSKVKPEKQHGTCDIHKIWHSCDYYKKYLGH